jgi:hypothetical protein
MPNSPNGPIRRAQLIVPFGTGAMVNVPGGTSLVVAGLDYWFHPLSGTTLDPNEFHIEEWRLQKILRVKHFRLPPDYREPFRGAGDLPNLKITVPAFRFPTWHFCPTCKLLTQRSMFERGNKGRIKCFECEGKGKTRYLVQVPFIAVCENGHLNDFPWNEWVHRSLTSTCKGKDNHKLRLFSTGSATLGGQKIKCEECYAERNLAGITSASVDTTTLSRSLSNDGEFTCPGERPWLGAAGKEECAAKVRGSLRSALNVYFAHVRSSIYLPRTDNSKIEDLLPKLESLPLSTLVKTLIDLKAPNDKILETMRTQQSALLIDFSDEDILSAIDIVKSDLPVDEALLTMDDVEIDDPLLFRKEEFDVLCLPRNEELLKIKHIRLSDYSNEITKYFSRIMLVDKLRETRALSGFSRVYAENEQNISQRKSMLWENTESIYSWLPAYIVYGEGIFLEFDEDKLRQWERLPAVQERVKKLVERYKISQEKRRIKYRPIGARYVLIHSFAHLLMNRLTFECGYSSAALRERLYVSDEVNQPMAGLLIYTADGDAEGTLGGLVRMGKAGNLEPTILAAIAEARWCSADPVCMEMGNLRGQGPDSCNLAACHNCSLVPETACEEFNRFLDRGVMIGDMDNSAIGFFNQ